MSTVEESDGIWTSWRGQLSCDAFLFSPTTCVRIDSGLLVPVVWPAAVTSARCTFAFHVAPHQDTRRSSCVSATAWLLLGFEWIFRGVVGTRFRWLDSAAGHGKLCWATLMQI
jgi:hypothetical protein